MTKSRTIVEKQVIAIMKRYNLTLQKNLYHNIETLDQTRHVSKEFISVLHDIRMIGNDCVHSTGKHVDRAHVTRLMIKYLRLSSEYSDNPWF